MEWQIHRARLHPAAHVVLPSTLSTKGQQFNRGAKPLTEQDWLEKRARNVPGPGTYPAGAAVPSGGKFNESRPRSDVDWKMLVPTFWSWLFMGVGDWVERTSPDELQQSNFSWQIKLLSRRSRLFGDLRELFPAGAKWQQ